MQEREDPIAVVVGLPRHGVGQRTRFGAVPQAVHPVDVGDSAGASDPAPLAERPGDPSGAAGRVDHHVVRQRRPVNDQAPGAAVVDRHRIHVPDPQVESGLGEGRLPQRPLEDQPPGPCAHLDVAGGRMVHVNRFGARRQPALVRVRHLGLESVGDLRTEAVRVMELHDALAGPRSVAGRSRVALDQVHAVTAPGEGNAEVEAGGAGADDADVHPFKVPEQGGPNIRSGYGYWIRTTTGLLGAESPLLLAGYSSHSVTNRGFAWMCTAS